VIRCPSRARPSGVDVMQGVDFQLMSSINLPEWIQAAAGVAIVYFTGRSLVVLKDYAADTKKIAKVGVHQADLSLQQIENSQKPFVALVKKVPDAHTQSAGGWFLENQGFGAAVNLRYTHGFDTSVWDYNTPVFGVGQFYHLMRFNIDTVRQHEFKIEYESLSGKKYRTSIIWVDGEMKMTFSGPL
jgi:hypothetical protein